ncbi:WYL domain-containing protein [Corynebacterium poyangense]|uniref:WYL domain-containing protein n=1 Tax=Corynebacterium poyangense TaxID=2684405 RepID=A0A7H0SNU4_9CORY|nr:WYL domain-containing protein [Corynebacterium poyangense]MBZ8177773.1 WYL domain-containing protein [Corynebacterium poyangense]QNQ90219.1 WYL domain-containing protein [Corynebacterium poyangense]
MSEENKESERLVNLLFAFIDADEKKNSGLSLDWIVDNVSGYAAKGIQKSSAKKKLRRDIKHLKLVGVPIKEQHSGGDLTLRLDQEHYALAPVAFSPEEATVLALAGDLGQSTQLAGFTRSGWVKIAASGVSREELSAPALAQSNDINQIPLKVLTQLLRAHEQGSRIRFHYQASPTSPPVLRTMDPWGVVLHRSRIYLVGFDIDREEPRSFRIQRVSDVAEIGPASHQPSKQNLQVYVEESLRRHKELVDICFRYRGTGAVEFMRIAQPRGNHRFILRGVDRDWAVRLAAGYAPDLVVESPPDVVAAIKDLLQVGESDACS